MNLERTEVCYLLVYLQAKKLVMAVPSEPIKFIAKVIG